MNTPTQSTNDPREQFTVEQFHARLREQGVPSSNDAAFRCVRCGAIQSMRSLILAGLKPEEAERHIGFSCVGRTTGAGGWDESPARAETVGCNWTCGGLFGALGRGVVILHDGEKHSMFWIATPEEARELMARNGLPFRSSKGGDP